METGRSGCSESCWNCNGVRWVPMAQVVLRKPACQRVAKSNSPSTTITEEERLTASHATRPAFGTWQQAVRESSSDTASKQVDDLAMVAPWEDHHAGKRRHGPGCRSNQCRAAT